MTVVGSDPTPRSSLERAAKVLDTFNGASSLTLTEVTRRTGLPRSTTHRMLEKLVAMHWLTRDANSYRVGLRMFELGSLVSHEHQARKASLPFLHELHRATGLIVHFAVRDGADVVHLERIGGRALSASGRIGGRLPANCTSLGKVLLAYGGDQPASVSTELVGLTARSITDPRVLQVELARVRQRGYAVSRDEAVVGVSCLAVPVRGPHQAAVGAISVGGPTASFQPDLVVASVREAAQRTYRQIHLTQTDARLAR
jgi:DNA-binding IclR family transcriptional regulator